MSRLSCCLAICAITTTYMSCAIAIGGDYVDVRDVDEIDTGPYIEALKESGLPAVDYVVSKFADHDVVFLGEKHGVQENCEFVADLIPSVYHDAGVRHFVSEFVPTRETERINRLVNGAAFDRQLAIDIMRGHAWPTWGYEEYMAIYQAVWRLNAALPEGAEPMRILGLDDDWSQHDLFFKHTNKSASMKVIMERESHMVEVVRGRVLDPDHKALVHIGYAHTITCHGMRLATVLYQSHGDRIFQVCLHHAFFEQGGPSTVTQLLERIVTESGMAPVGFDVLGTPFGSLRDPNNMAYTMGGERGLAQLAQGYVLIKPIEDLQPVHWIDGFINEVNFPQAIEVAEKLGKADPTRHNTPAKLDARMKQVTESR